MIVLAPNNDDDNRDEREIESKDDFRHARG